MAAYRGIVGIINQHTAGYYDNTQYNRSDNIQVSPQSGPVYVRQGYSTDQYAGQVSVQQVADPNDWRQESGQDSGRPVEQPLTSPRYQVNPADATLCGVPSYYPYGGVSFSVPIQRPVPPIPPYDGGYYGNLNSGYYNPNSGNQFNLVVGSGSRSGWHGGWRGGLHISF